MEGRDLLFSPSPCSNAWGSERERERESPSRSLGMQRRKENACPMFKAAATLRALFKLYVYGLTLSCGSVGIVS